MPRDIDKAPVTANQTVWTPCNWQWNEASGTALSRVFYSLQWYNSRWKIQDQDLCEFWLESKARGAAYSVMVTSVWRWFTRLGGNIILHLWMSILYETERFKTWLFSSTKRIMLEKARIEKIENIASDPQNNCFFVCIFSSFTSAFSFIAAPWVSGVTRNASVCQRKEEKTQNTAEALISPFQGDSF